MATWTVVPAAGRLFPRLDCEEPASGRHYGGGMHFVEPAGGRHYRRCANSHFHIAASAYVASHALWLPCGYSV